MSSVNANSVATVVLARTNPELLAGIELAKVATGTTQLGTWEAVCSGGKYLYSILQSAGAYIKSAGAYIKPAGAYIYGAAAAHLIACGIAGIFLVVVGGTVYYYVSESGKEGKSFGVKARAWVKEQDELVREDEARRIADIRTHAAEYGFNVQAGGVNNAGSSSAGGATAAAQLLEDPRFMAEVKAKIEEDLEAKFEARIKAIEDGHRAEVAALKGAHAEEIADLKRAHKAVVDLLKKDMDELKQAHQTLLEQNREQKEELSEMKRMLQELVVAQQRAAGGGGGGDGCRRRRVNNTE